MHLNSAPWLASLGLSVVVLVAPSGCSDDGSGTEASTNTMTTQSSPASATDASEATGAPTTSAATGETTGDPSASATATTPATMPTSDATSDATTGGGSGAQYCQEACGSDADCAIMGMDQGYTCENDRCTNVAFTCTVDDECDSILSGWSQKCQTHADCPGLQCIDIADPAAGRCAIAPIPGVLECSTFPGFSEVMAKAFEDQAPVAVCANKNGKCEDSYCFDPCESDADCPAQVGAPSCNTDTGRCECTSDADCQAAGVASLTTCNAGVCGCSQDSDCAGSNYADTCFQGTCGCSSVGACMQDQAFDGTTKVCEGI